MSLWGKKKPDPVPADGADTGSGNAYISGTAAAPGSEMPGSAGQAGPQEAGQDIHQVLHDFQQYASQPEVHGGMGKGGHGGALGYDWLLFVFAVMIIGIGLIMVLSASGIVASVSFHDKYYFFRKQVAHAAFGAFCLFLAARIPLRVLYNRTVMYSLLAGTFFLLLLTLSPLAPAINGAHRWLKMGPATIQPVEFLKIAMALYLAYYMSSKQSMIKTFTRGMLAPCIATALCCLILIVQPDFGSFVVLTSLFCAMCLVGGTRKIYFVGMFFATVVIAVLAVLCADYRMERVIAFLDPFDPSKPAAYQLKQSLLAIGSGSFFGVGIGASRQKLFYLPEAHNDFIMAVLAEEVGFLGVSVVMLLFALFFWRCYRIIQGQAELRDRYSAFAVTLILALPVCMNLAVVMGAVPTKGVPMPFMSYGGSNLVSYMICVGLLLNFSRTANLHEAQAAPPGPPEQPSESPGAEG